MPPHPPSIGNRLRYVRGKWRVTPSELATMAGVGVATIRRTERDDTVPTRKTVTKLANALCIRADWLATGDSGGMLLPVHMTMDYQFKMHTGPGTEGLPGFVVIDPGGPWYRDRRGTWQVDRQS